MDVSTDLTVVTTVTSPYVRFLGDWASSLKAQTVRPAAVLIVGNGLGRQGRLRATAQLEGLPGRCVDLPLMGFGAARNAAIAQVTTPWCSHLDSDDVLLPDALAQVATLADGADVVSLGYQQRWPGNAHGYPRTVLYQALDGLAALKAPRIASGCSPFRREMWVKWPYVERLASGWDLSLWLGLARLGARFRPTTRPAFLYTQWPGSHWRRVGQYRHEDLLQLRRLLEAEGVEGAKAALAVA
jgi:hypothetical protein